MRFNKKTLDTILFIGLFCFAGIVFGAGDATITNPLGGVEDFGTLFGNIAKGIGQLIAGLGTIMFIVSGIMFLFSAGNPQKINNAKTALIYAIIGIVVGLAASSIVDFVKKTVG